MVLCICLNPTIDRVIDFKAPLKKGAVNRVGSPTVSAGGKGINVARMLNIFGIDTTVAGFIGGYTGEFIKQNVKGEFIEVENATRISTSIIEDGKATEILEEGPNISEEKQEEFISLYKKLIKTHKYIVASGSLAKGIPTDFYGKLIEISRPFYSKFILDTSGEALIHGIKAKPFMVKPNLEEYENLKDMEIEKYIEFPVISRGAEGLVAFIDGIRHELKSHNVKAVNTIGCGDALVSGIVAGLYNGKSKLEALKLGISAAAANASFLQTGYITKELTYYYNGIDIWNT